MKHPVFLFLAALAAFPLCALASNYNEATDGNLSNNHLAPTSVPVTPGLNSIRGTLGMAGQDYDFATIKVPSGYAMTTFKLDALTNNGGGTAFSIAKGTSSPIVPYGSNAVGLLGFLVLGPANVGTANYLPAMGLPNRSGYGNTGFSGPLPAGDYTFWIQDYNYNVTYKFSFLLEKASAPVVNVTGQKVINKKVSLKVKASGIDTRLSYRVGKSGSFKKVSGPSPWAFLVSHLKVGKNVVTLKAEGSFGTTTKRLVVTVKK